MASEVIHYPRSRLFPQGPLPIYARRFTHFRAQPTHDHDFMELVLVVGGRAMHRSPRGVHALHRGDVIVLRPGAWHGYEQCHSLRIVNCCFGAEMLRHELAWMLDDPVINPLLWGRPLREKSRGIYHFRLDSCSMHAASRLLDDLHDETQGDRQSSARRLARLILVIEYLARHLPLDPAARTGPLPQPLPPLAQQAVRLLDQHIAHPWQTRELSKRLGVDVSYAIRLVKLATGLPPLAYLSRVRAEAAASLLVRTQHAITDIGQQIGWPDPAYFARRFRTHFGLSATKYRSRFTAKSS